MKDVNVMVDVDLTLVDLDYNLLPGAREALTRLKKQGCNLFLWSSAGAGHARRMAAKHRLKHLFSGYAAKPDVIIDDDPGSTLPAYAFTVNHQTPWKRVAQGIVNHVID